MYYPKSQIQTNLYTNGGEYYLKGKQSSYIGYYWKTSQNKFYTGKTPNSGDNLELLGPSNDSFSANDNYPSSILGVGQGLTIDSIITLDKDGIGDSDPVYDFGGNLINEKIAMEYQNVILLNTKEGRIIPQYYRTLPPANAQINYLRYFAKQNNAPIFIETSKETYNKFSSNDPMMATDLYTVLPVPWSIEENASSVNRFTVNKIEKENQWYGFHHYFKGVFDDTESISESLYTNGGEFVLPDRTNYVGFYHFMPNGTAMTGKNHGDKPEIILIPLINKPTLTLSNQTDTTTNQTTPTTTQPTYTPPASSGGGGGGY